MSWPTPCSPRQHPVPAPPHRQAPTRSDACRPRLRSFRRRNAQPGPSDHPAVPAHARPRLPRQAGPAACNRAIPSDQDDPLANSPCTRTTFLAVGAGCAAAAVPWTRVLAAPAATMLTNARRFIGFLGRRSSWLFMEGFPLPEIEVSHFKGSIWLTTSLEGVAIARGTANALTEKGLAHTGQGLLLLSPHIGFDRHKNNRTRPPNSCGGTRNLLPTRARLAPDEMLLRTSAYSSSLTTMPKS